MGLSCARVGILNEHIPINVCNIAVSAQDIFYNYKTLEYIAKKYRNSLENLRYVVYDVFDYTYLNYDVSMSKNACQYYKWGGFSLDPHNFISNKNFEIEYSNIMSGLNMPPKHVDVFCNNYIKNTEFVVWYNKTEDDMVNSRCNIVSDEEILSYDGDNSLINNTFINTINENIILLDKTMELLMSINPKMTIKLLILPHLKEACQLIEEKYLPAKISFMNAINGIRAKWSNVEFYDFKIHDSFDNKLYFYDCEHLNYYGAKKFTSVLNEIMGW